MNVCIWEQDLFNIKALLFKISVKCIFKPIYIFLQKMIIYSYNLKYLLNNDILKDI